MHAISLALLLVQRKDFQMIIVVLSHGSRTGKNAIDSFTHQFDALLCPNILRQKGVKKSGGVIILSTST